jgi:hypothetical protein
MANKKALSVINSILGLYDAGWKKLRMARELNIDVKTVHSYSILVHQSANSLLVLTGINGCSAYS